MKKLKELAKNIYFWGGFLFGMAGVIIFNLFTFSIPTDQRIHHYTHGFGFPLSFYEWGGNPYIEKWSTAGLIFDIVFAFVYSILVGLFFSYVWTRFTARRVL